MNGKQLVELIENMLDEGLNEEQIIDKILQLEKNKVLNETMQDMC